MKIMYKLMAAFMVVILLNIVGATIVGIKFNDVKNNVKTIVDKSDPAVEAIMDIRIQNGWIFACHSELVEGAMAYKVAIREGKSKEEALAIADPIYKGAIKCVDEHHQLLEQAVNAFEEIGYFSGKKAEEVDEKIGVHDKTLKYIHELEADYRSANWEKS